MIQRCHNKKHFAFKYYGGRGIVVCSEWRSSFDAFLAHIGPRPSKKHGIDRIDNSGCYEPGNVRWATMKEQTQNFRKNHLITFCGVTKPIGAWARDAKIHHTTFANRIGRLGWDISRALSTPVRKKAS
jgi:hypothetical protein